MYTSYHRPDRPEPTDPEIYHYIGAPKLYQKHKTKETVPCLLK